jgi:DNA/RNA endonuclease G (NUC1)
MYPGTGGDRTCSDNTAPFYWTWYSLEHLSPILSAFDSNGCGATNPRFCPDASRYKGSFYDCGFSGVDTKSYTWSGFDRGHLVNSQAGARMYDASCQTFNMCNIGPQSPQLNQRDWVAIENLAQELSEAKKGIIVMQGGLMSSSTTPQCVCGATTQGGTLPGGTTPCDNVEARGDCNAKNWQIRVPYAFFKTVIDTGTDSGGEKASWSFLYTKSQSEISPQPTCSGVCETPDEALVKGPAAVAERVERAAGFHSWEAVSTVAKAECSWCSSFNRSHWEALGPLVGPEEALEAGEGE